jgi:hypothetical protein
LQNLGNHKFPVKTTSAQAQLFINQGMILAYGFNHSEAARSFREAARLDPNCAMAYWGMSLVLGANINMAMSPEAEPQAYAMIQKAIALKKNASEKERAYIDALAKRYSGEGRPNRSALDIALRGRPTARPLPERLDVATLCEAPWIGPGITGRVICGLTRKPWNSAGSGTVRAQPEPPGAIHLTSIPSKRVGPSC